MFLALNQNLRCQNLALIVSPSCMVLKTLKLKHDISKTCASYQVFIKHFSTPFNS